MPHKLYDCCDRNSCICGEYEHRAHGKQNKVRRIDKTPVDKSQQALELSKQLDNFKAFEILTNTSILGVKELKPLLEGSLYLKADGSGYAQVINGLMVAEFDISEIALLEK
jgi:hypothetical protein